MPGAVTATAAAWHRLQCLSCEHSLRLYRSGQSRSLFGAANPRRYPKIIVPEVIKENVEILGRGDEAELKARVLWYATFHPVVFSACSAAGWKYGTDVSERRN